MEGRSHWLTNRENAICTCRLLQCHSKSSNLRFAKKASENRNIAKYSSLRSHHKSFNLEYLQFQYTPQYTVTLVFFEKKPCIYERCIEKGILPFIGELV